MKSPRPGSKKFLKYLVSFQCDTFTMSETGLFAVFVFLW